MIDFRLLIIWQPLHTPSGKRVPRAKNGELGARALVEQHALRPAFAGAQHIAVAKPAARRRCRGNPAATRRPLRQIRHVHVERLNPARVKRRGHLDLAVDALFAQDRRPGAYARLR